MTLYNPINKVNVKVMKSGDSLPFSFSLVKLNILLEEDGNYMLEEDGTNLLEENNG